MDYASKCIAVLPLPSLSKCVTASASVTQLLSVRPLRSKPFRVTNAERSLKKGLTAHALEDLRHKTVLVLVLEEDGTEIDSEDFFQTVPENSVLMVLDKGEKWTPLSVSSSPSAHLGKCDQDRTDVATLYGAYSVSYEVRCYAAKKLLKEALRWTVFSMQATGHILLGSSCYIEHLLKAEDEGKINLMLPGTACLSKWISTAVDKGKRYYTWTNPAVWHF
uniref:Cell death inducing DFFA like effector c n=1 Tax=Neogobius melanostomus TaxID=47308 RepID=A0A8C6UC01_9GOBI